MTCCESFFFATATQVSLLSLVETRYPDATMPGWVSIPELILLLVVILLIFGPKRVPEIGRSLGKGMREFKNSITGRDEEEPRPAEIPAAPREHDSVS
jgi:sec-independent protein translocase protein TatA